jgi:hypothetical protein
MFNKIKQLYNFFSPKRQNLFLEYKTEFKPRYGHGKAPHKKLNSIIESYRENYKELLSEFLEFKEFIQEIKKSKEETDVDKPVWNNGYLPGLDIISLYSLISKINPTTYLEIGSGNSTKVARLAKSDQGLKTKIVSIDPYPRTEIKGVADQIINNKIEDTDLNQILHLEKNDILFIDNSHRVLPNSDAMVVFMDILPYLKKGVYVHIHDIYLPYDYPQFMCDRFYSEQYVLASMIMANPEKYHTIMPNFFVSEDEELASIISPLWDHENLKSVERHGGSYWFQIR